MLGNTEDSPVKIPPDDEREDPGEEGQVEVVVEHHGRPLKEREGAWAVAVCPSNRHLGPVHACRDSFSTRQSHALLVDDFVFQSIDVPRIVQVRWHMRRVGTTDHMLAWHLEVRIW